MNIINVWLALPLQKRILSITSVVATLALMYLMANIALKPKLSLLYSGLDPATAGDVIAKLEGMDVDYDVRGDSIFAESGRRDSLRLELAREGLPRQSVIGYELFDNLNSFAMSSDMFDTAYWRAKEGELARTILAMPNIRAARVHLGTQKASGFRDSASASTASVTISTSSGVNGEQAKAIQFLTALSVVGLSPEDVAIIDTVRGLVAGPGLGTDMAMSGDGELERAGQLKQNLLSMLEARVGVGNARVNVSLDIDRTHERTTERSFDPDGRVVRSQSTTDSSDTSTGTTGNVTVASNLPQGAAGGGTNNAERTDSTETVTYEISEVVRDMEITPGAIKRMTVAVLVSDQQNIGETGQITYDPRSEEELQTLRDLVAAASGLDEDRGDTLTVKSLPFDRPIEPELISKPSVMEQFLDQYLWSTIQSLLLAIVILVMGLFVVRPLLLQRKGVGNSDNGPELLPMGMNPETGRLTDGTDTGAIDQNGGLPALGFNPDLANMGEMGMGDMGMGTMGLGAPVQNDPFDILNDTVAESPEDSADLLASWLAMEERPA